MTRGPSTKRLQHVVSEYPPQPLASYSNTHACTWRDLVRPPPTWASSLRVPGLLTPPNASTSAECRWSSPGAPKTTTCGSKLGPPRPLLQQPLHKGHPGYLFLPAYRVGSCQEHSSRTWALPQPVGLVKSLFLRRESVFPTLCFNLPDTKGTCKPLRGFTRVHCLLLAKTSEHPNSSLGTELRNQPQE